MHAFTERSARRRLRPTPTWPSVRIRWRARRRTVDGSPIWGRAALMNSGAYAHFDAWATEDTYFPVDDELAAMRDTTFQAECIWQDPPHTLLVGRKT